MAKKILSGGAGIGGLTAASCLLKAGHDVLVVEQAPAVAEIGAGIKLSANEMRVLNDLGLGGAISTTAVRPAAYVFRLHDTGEMISRFSLAEEHERLNGAPYNQLHRADLHGLLAAKATQLKKDVIRLNSRIVGFEESAGGIRAQLASGETLEADLLIGADGVKSTIRTQLAAADRPTHTGAPAGRRAP